MYFCYITKYISLPFHMTIILLFFNTINSQNSVCYLYIQNSKKNICYMIKKNLKSSKCTSERPRNRNNKHKQTIEPVQILDPYDYQKFVSIIKNRNRSIISKKMNEYYEQLYIPNYKEKYGFKEQWQNIKVKEYKIDNEIIVFQGHFDIFVNILVMLCFTSFIWLANVEFFFGNNRRPLSSKFIFLIPTVFQFIDLALILTHDTNLKVAEVNAKKAISLVYKHVFCLIYYSLKLTEIPQQRQLYWLILQLPCLYIMFSRASQIYKSFRVKSISMIYQYQFKAFDMIFNLILVAHSIAIIIYQLTFVRTDNWFAALNITDNSQLVHYIYSFYFGCTTILTVGYGDIVPKNHIEIAIVCLIELFGIAIFAYLINQIGYNLSNLRKSRQTMEKDLSTLQKFKRYYKINPELEDKARSYLLNNSQAIDRLKPQEDNQIVMKFSEPLRNQLLKHRSLSIVKSSIFLLCRWTKEFQNSIAASLTGILLSHGEKVFQPEGKERIYIVRLGKIDFHKVQKGSQKQDKNVLKSIDVGLNRQVSDNLFGYTTVIGGKSVTYQAISRDFTSAFYINKERFLNCVLERSTDCQYYHEIKDKIYQSRIPDSIQIPSLINNKHHYNPSRLLAAKKRRIKDNVLRNERSNYIRQNRKKVDSIQWKIKNFQPFEATVLKCTLNDSLDSLSVKNQSQNNSDKVDPRGTILPINECSIKTIIRQEEMTQFKDTMKQYTNYFPFQNIQKVLLKYDNNTLSSIGKRHPSHKVDIKKSIHKK